jgi:hypothetical protein
MDSLQQGEKIEPQLRWADRTEEKKIETRSNGQSVLSNNKRDTLKLTDCNKEKKKNEQQEWPVLGSIFD